MDIEFMSMYVEVGVQAIKFTVVYCFSHTCHILDECAAI
jgi:hypothetical protein